MEILYYLNGYAVAAVLGYLAIGVVVRLVLVIDQKMGGRLRKCFIRLRFVPVLVVVVALWGQQSRLWFDRISEYHPDVAYADLVGTWRDGDMSLTITERGTAILNDEMQFQYEFGDSEVPCALLEYPAVRLTGETRMVCMDVIRFNGKLRLTGDVNEEGFGELGFTKE